MGGYSLVNAELLLLKKATTKGKYSYYHLLSGQDLPIQSQEYIYRYFSEHYGIEFIGFDSNEFKYRNRVGYYYPLQERIGRDDSIIIRGAMYVMRLLQKTVKIERNKGVEFQKGSNWFSITDSLARYVVSMEQWIHKVFHSTLCCDEIFLQTVVVNSEFKNRLVKNNLDNSSEMNMRLIDWERGNPHIFRLEDFDILKKSDMLFARKFSDKIDRDIIEKIMQLYG